MARGPYEKSSKSGSSVGLKATIAESEVGGGTVSVGVGVSVDVLPVDIGISVDNGDLSVSGEVGLPGDVLSVGGGAVIDLNTGAVIGGSATLGIGGAVVEVSQVECERGLSISYFGISLGYSQDICGKKDDEGNGNNNEDDDNGNNNNKPLDPSDFPETPALLVFTKKPVYKCTQAPASIVRVLNPNIELTQTVIDYGFLAQQGTLTRLRYLILQDVVNGDFIGDYSYPTGRTNWCCLSENTNSNPASVLPRWRFNVGFLGSLYEPWIVTGGEFLWETDQVSFSCYSLEFQAVELVYTANPRKFIQAHNYLSFEGIDKFTVGGNFGSIFFGRHFRSSQKVDRIIPISLGEDLRRPIPSGKDMSDCCDASISLLRKISKVLAVDKILVEGEQRISTETVESFKKEYEELIKKMPKGQKPKVFFEDYLQFKIYQLATSDVEDIATVLNVREMLRGTQKNASKKDKEEGGIVVPNSLIMYQGEGTTQIRDYVALSEFVIRMIDHLGLHPSEIKIADINKGKEGDQPVTFEPYSGSAMINKLLELSFENKGDAATRLQIQVRTVWLLHQILSYAAKINENTKNIVNFLEIPFKEVVTVIKTPFDILLGKKDQFKKSGVNPSEEDILKIIEEDTEESVEGILDKFLNVSDHIVKVNRHVSGMGLGFWYTIRNLRK